ncbi:MAG: secretion system protein E, partial [Halobacteriaceae archaeon]
MATDQAGSSDGTDEDTQADVEQAAGTGPDGSSPGVGDYTWRDFVEERESGDTANTLYRRVDSEQYPERTHPTAEDWERVDIDPSEYLGRDPSSLPGEFEDAASSAKGLQGFFDTFCDPSTTPVTKGEWYWEHFKYEYYYGPDGEIPSEPFDETEYLNFEDENTEGVLSFAEDQASDLADLIEERTVDINEDIDEDDFFSTIDGETTLVNRYDLEKSVSIEKKKHFREVDRYWVNKPYAFVMLFHSRRENEKKYYLVEPYRNEIEEDLQSFLTEKLRTAIKYASDEVVAE